MFSPRTHSSFLCFAASKYRLRASPPCSKRALPSVGERACLLRGCRAPQVVPCDKQKATDQPEMLEERIGGHEPLLARRQLPEAQRDQRRHQRKACECEGR